MPFDLSISIRIYAAGLTMLPVVSAGALLALGIVLLSRKAAQEFVGENR